MNKLNQRVRDIAEVCRAQKELIVATGPEAVREKVCDYLIKHSPYGAVLMHGIPTSSASSVSHRLCVELSLEPPMFPYASNEVIEDARQRVEKKIKMEGALVVLDDADRDSRESLGALRRLFDMGGLGLILMGSRKLLKALEEGRGEFGQLAARISGTVNLAAEEGCILWSQKKAT